MGSHRSLIPFVAASVSWILATSSASTILVYDYTVKITTYKVASHKTRPAMDVGKHCSVTHCSQIDFLPFECDCCHSVFCLDHRSYTSHSCTSVQQNDQRVFECPICKKLIDWTPDQDIDQVWNAHTLCGDCVAISGDRLSKKKKVRCAALQCRTVIGPSNRFECTTCSQIVCLAHRFPNDHLCRKPQNRNVRFTSKKQTNFTASTIIQQSKETINSVLRTSVKTEEKCPICEKSFAYVSQLIAHVNSKHPEIDRSSTLTGAKATERSNEVNNGRRHSEAASREIGGNVCRHCNAVFPNASTRLDHESSTHRIAGRVHASKKQDRGDSKCIVM
ncbi:hypothetical protein ABG067_006813 [Albugo candida]